MDCFWYKCYVITCISVGLIGAMIYVLSVDIQPKGGLTLAEKVHVLKILEGRAP